MFDISLLKDMKLTELQEIAKQVDIKKYRAMKKDVLITNIIEFQEAQIQKETKPEKISKPRQDVKSTDNKPKRKRIVNPEIAENTENLQSEIKETPVDEQIKTEVIQETTPEVIQDVAPERESPKEVVTESPRKEVSVKAKPTNRNTNERTNTKDRNSNKQQRTHSIPTKNTNNDSVSNPTETKEVEENVVTETEKNTAPVEITGSYIKRWLKAAGVRAIKTIAQTMIASIGTSAIISTVDWKIVISSSLLAGILSILTSIKGLPEIK